MKFDTSVGCDYNGNYLPKLDLREKVEQWSTSVDLPGHGAFGLFFSPTSRTYMVTDGKARVVQSFTTWGDLIEWVFEEFGIDLEGK